MWQWAGAGWVGEGDNQSWACSEQTVRLSDWWKNQTIPSLTNTSEYFSRILHFFQRSPYWISKVSQVPRDLEKNWKILKNFNKITQKLFIFYKIPAKWEIFTGAHLAPVLQTQTKIESLTALTVGGVNMFSCNIGAAETAWDVIRIFVICPLSENISPKK